MENALGEDISVGVYKTEDKITNLKIRVKVRKIANACFTEKDSLALGDSNELELVNLMKSSSIAAERIFQWQEKVEKTDNSEDGRGASSSRKDSVTLCLFSYTDSDILSPQWKSVKSYTSPSSQVTHLESQMKPKNRFSGEIRWQKPLFSSITKIIKEKSNLKETCVSVGQSMAILAALFFEDSATVEEIDLCFLQVDDHGTLTVIPDFSKRKSYIFINSRSETFEYEIENVSNIPKSSAIQREKNLMKKIAIYKRKLKEDATKEEFLKIFPETTSFTLNFEIVSAKKFSSADIFIHYLIIIPKGCSSESLLEGVTETCRRNNSAVAYYGFTSSVDISANIGVSEFKDKPLKILFEATSVDYWGNFRNEGYGYGDIQMMPGMISQDIGTWKIEPNTLKHKLQNLFIGGMPHLDDLSYIINPKDTEDSQLSKYGVRTISSGVITFKTSVIQQSQP